MMICDKCGEGTYIIFITSKYEKICDKCYDKQQKEKSPKYPVKE